MSPRVDQPIAGHYSVRLVKRGPLLPLRIWFGPPFDPVTREPLDRSYDWRAELIGDQVSVWRFWPYCAASRISETEYRFMLSDRAWLLEHQPSSPEADPRARVDIADLPVPF